MSNAWTLWGRVFILSEHASTTPWPAPSITHFPCLPDNAEINYPHLRR